MIRYLEKHKLFFVYIPLILYWCVLLILTSIPGSYSPNIGVSDKIEHAGAYLVLAVLINLTYMFQRKIPELYKKPALFTFFTVFFYGLVDEIHQMVIPGRFADVRDLAADVIGGIAGILFVLLIKKINWQDKVETSE